MWRSLLFMPVLEERFLARAHDRGADAVVLDLEASVAAGRKQEARAALGPAIDRLGAAGQDVLVRVNMPWRPVLADLEFAVRDGVRAIVVPGADTCEHMRVIDGCIGELEAERGLPQGGIRVIPIIETARGVRDADTVLRSSDRIVAVGFGIGDYLADMAAPASMELQTITSLGIVEAARAAGAVPLVIPESLANLDDMETFRAAALRGLNMGSEGGFAAHPDQVECLNSAFTPSAEEVAAAERVVMAGRAAQEAGTGAMRLDGRMVEMPVIIHAERLLARARRADAADRAARLRGPDRQAASRRGTS